MEVRDRILIIEDDRSIRKFSGQFWKRTVTMSFRRIPARRATA